MLALIDRVRGKKKSEENDSRQTKVGPSRQMSRKASRETLSDDRASIQTEAVSQPQGVDKLSEVSLQQLYQVLEFSPSAQTVFEQDETTILATVLERECSSDMLQLLQVCMKAQELHGAPARQIKDLVRDRRSAPPIPLTEWNLQQLRDAADLHYNIVVTMDILHRYCSRKSPKTSATKHPLSQTESGRFQRALYQYELYCRLFSSEGPKVELESPHSTSGLTLAGDYNPESIFFSVLEPWEVEEIACVHEFLAAKYEFLMARIKDKWRSPYAEDNFAASDDSLHETALPESMREYTLQKALAQGVRFFVKAVSLSDDVDALRKHIREDSEDLSGLPLPEALKLESSNIPDFRDPKIDIPDEFIEQYAALKFTGDHLPKPNKGWSLAHKDEMSYWYAEAEFQPLRQWGYVFWDAEYFESDGAAYKEIQKYAYSRHRYDCPWEFLGT